MKNTLDDDFQTFVDYHFPRESRRPLMRIARLIRLLHQNSPDAIEAADEVASYVRGHVHRELGVECKVCGGEGVRTYGSGSTWRGGIGTASCTDDVCDVCWGTGRSDMQGLDLRALRGAK